MKSFDDFDKNIDRYYEESLDGVTSDELQIKDALDKMSIISDIENDIPIFANISSIVEEGQEIRFKINLRKATFKFVTLALLISSLLGFMCIKVSISITIGIQFILLIVMLLTNTIILKTKARRDV